MVTRVVLALVAVLVLAWVGVLLRNYDVGREAAIQRDPEGIQRAQLLDPNAYWDQLRASVYLLNGDPRHAAETAEALVHEEPQNPVAWAVLRAATRRIDPSRSAQATAELRRLNPLTAP